MSINKFEEAISKGFKDMESAQANFELRREVKENSEAIKFNNSRLLQVERLTEAIYQNLNKLPKLEGFEAAAEKIAVNVTMLNETLRKFGEEDNPKTFDEKQRKLGEYVR